MDGQPLQPKWYTGANRGQWLALTAALLGWAFDGFEMGVFPLVGRTALVELLSSTEAGRVAKDSSLSAPQREDAYRAFNEEVRQWFNIINATFLFGAAVGGWLFGWIGDRWGRVRAMVFCVLTYAMFTGFCGLAQEAWQLAVLRFIAALGMGGEWSLGVALVMESWSAHARPVLAGLIGAAANLGFLLTGTLGLVLNPEGYWRIILIVCVFPALLTFFLRLFVPESAKWEQAVATGPRPGLAAIFGPRMWRHSLLGACLGAVALLATWGGVQAIAPWVQGTAPGKGPYVLICSALGATVGAFLGAVIGERFSRRLGYFALCLLSLVMCEYLFWGPEERAFDVWFFGMVVLVGAFSAAFYGWLPLYLPELFPTRVRATGQGFCFNFGRSLAAVGVLLTTFTINLGGRYALASSIVCLVYLVGMVLAWYIPETKGQPLPE